MAVRWVTREEMRAVDRRAIEEFGIPAIVLMENAGRGSADEVGRLARERGARGLILIACGGGNNGGDGLVAARHLSNAGHAVHILFLGDRGAVDRGREAGVNLTICERMGLPITDGREAEALPAAEWLLGEAALVVDAVFGIGLATAPREPEGSVLRAIAEAALPTLAVDVPSGLDADTGQPLGEAVVRADVTATMACPKVGFRGPGEATVGRCVVVDIGLPAALVRE